MRIYVSNLAYQVTAEDLQSVFIAYHKVESAFIIKDRTTGKSKGFGYVDITPDSEAKAAIEELNGKILQDRPLVLKVALPPKELKAGDSPAQLKRDARSPARRFNKGGGAAGGKGNLNPGDKRSPGSKPAPGSRTPGGRGGQDGERSPWTQDGRKRGK